MRGSLAQTKQFRKSSSNLDIPDLFFFEGKKFKNELMIIFSGMSCRVGSIASSRQSGRSRSYRTKSKRSEVDESLFGSANSAAKLRANCRSNKPETVQGQYLSEITII